MVEERCHQDVYHPGDDTHKNTIHQDKPDEKVNTKEDTNSNTSSQFGVETGNRTPVIYTTRLEDMSVFLQDITHISPRELCEHIERESQPLFKKLNNQTTDVEIQLLLHNHMLDKIRNYKYNMNSNQLKAVDKLTSIDLNTIQSSKEKIKSDSKTTTTTTLKTTRKTEKYNLTQKINNNKVIVISSDDDDDEDNIAIKDLHEILKQHKRNKSLLSLCKPVKVVLQDVRNIITANQFPKPKDKHQTQYHNINSETRDNTSNYRVYTHRTSTGEPLSKTPKNHQWPELIPPEGFTWNPVGTYVVFHDLCTKETEAYLLDDQGCVKEYYKDLQSAKKIEEYITSHKCIKLNCCCWHKREAYVKCMSPVHIPQSTAQMFRKPHRCQFNHCSCCCNGIVSDDSLTAPLGLNQDISLTGPQVINLYPDRKEYTHRHIIEKCDYIEELLFNRKNSVSLINRALKFNRNMMKEKSFEIESGLDYINRCQNLMNIITLKNTLNRINDISNEKVILHAGGVRRPSISVLKDDHGQKMFCCWYKLQSMCEQFSFKSLSTTKHSCSLENCTCCCKPVNKIEKLSPINLPTRVRHTKIFRTPLINQTSHKELTNATTKTISKIPKTSKAKETMTLAPILILESIGPTNNIKDKVGVLHLESSNGKRENPPNVVDSKKLSGHAVPKSSHVRIQPAVSIDAFNNNTPDITDAVEPLQITDAFCATTSTTSMITEEYGKHFVTPDTTHYPIITNVFSTLPQTADFSIDAVPAVASLSSGLSETSFDSQENMVETLIVTVLETFKDVRLTINADGKVAAVMGTPVHKLSTVELKILANILSHAQSQVDSLDLQPGNINKSLYQSLDTAINTIKIPPSTNNTRITTAVPTQTAPSVMPKYKSVRICPCRLKDPSDLSAKMSTKVMDCAKCYQSSRKLKNIPECKKRKMKHEEPVTPKIRVVSPTRLGATNARNPINERPTEETYTFYLPNSESSPFSYSVTESNLSADNSLQHALTETIAKLKEEMIIDNEVDM